MKMLADPVAWVWLGMLVAAAVQFARRKRKSAGALLALILAANLLQLADVPGRLMASLERPYFADPPRLFAPADAVVVLGGYGAPNSSSYTGFRSGQAVDRLLTGIALVREGKGSVLVLGGPDVRLNGVTEGEAAVAFIRSWNLTSVPVQPLNSRMNTHNEAVRCAELARKNGWKRLLLVSSAAHLRRATAAFRKAGLDVTPVGCDFRGRSRLRRDAKTAFIPDVYSLVTMRLWSEEVLGYLYYGIRGWV